MKKHDATHHQIQNITCSLCPAEDKKRSEKLYSKDSLEIHIETVHRRAIKCPLCDWKDSQKVKLREHFLAKHMNYFQFRCRTCKKEFGKLFNARYHYQQVHLKNSSRKLDTEFFKTNSNVIEDKKYTDPNYPTDAQIEEMAKNNG